ncbi:MAG: transporter substrate-binding domain-containing protein [Desulfovibrio sp.]|nr:transporter substrate-binding domain-containing protein [Desulfovibrio sp.]
MAIPLPAQKSALGMFMLLCLCLAWLSPLYADDQAVRVGYFENEIFQEGARQGAVRNGYAYDYYRKLAEYTGWHYEYVYGSFGDLYQKLLTGEIDLLAGLAKTEERVGRIGYPELAMGHESYLMVKHAQDERITADYTSLVNARIGVLDSAMVQALRLFLEKHHCQATIVTFPDHQSLFQAFDSQNVDLMVAESDGSYSRENAEVLFSFGSTAYYLCTSIKRPDLLQKLNRAQEELQLEEPNYLYSLSIKYYSKSILSNALSSVEKAWLAKNRVLRIGYLNNYLPFSSTSSQGQVTGMLPELIASIYQSLGLEGLTTTYLGYDNYDTMVQDVRDNKLDIIFPVGGGRYFSEESEIYQTKSVVTSTPELVYSGEYHEENQPHFAVNTNNRMQDYYIRTNFPNARITYYQSIADCLQAVLNGDVQFTTINGIRANSILKNYKYRKLSVKQIGINDDRCLGVRIGNESLLKLLNHGISLFGEDNTQRMAYKYLGGLYNYTLTEMIMSHFWIFALIFLSIATLLIVFFARETSNAKKHMLVKESARKELEEKNKELAIAVKAAENANKAKTYFLSTMSHDIRTPLNSILSMNEMVLRECDNEDILIYSGHIRSSGNTLLGLINDILDFSRIEAGKLEIIPVDYQLSSVLNDLMNLLQARTEAKGLGLELQIDRNIPNYLHGDEIRIKQIITNLLTNAVKYTKTGKVTFIMGYSTIADNPGAIELWVSVKDTGIGIKKEDMGRLFGAFERINETHNRNIEGTGLGIPITQKLLDLMGSQLVVESYFGQGSTFSFRLRQKVVQWEAVGDYRTAFKRSVAQRKKYQESFTAPQGCLLVVDDTPVNLTVVKSLLKRTKLQIDTAMSGDECLKMSTQKKYDMIFMDHMMPTKDGIEAMQELKAMKDNPNARTPVICLTANAIAGMRDTYLAAGFDDYLSKPIDPDRLEAIIVKYLPPEKMQLKEQKATEPFVDKKNSEIPDFLYQIQEIDLNTGLRHCGNASIYLEALSAYVETISQNAQVIADYWQKQDIKNLTIKVHALKSSARIIGALSLASLAEKLEQAGHDHQLKVLADNLETLLSNYRALGQKLGQLQGQGEKPESATSSET